MRVAKTSYSNCQRIVERIGGSYSGIRPVELTICW